ncbi:TetR family transcriptional regulator [Mesorhizobium sp. L-8-10]|uniref:TetR/AcrR family transcriptional regulator n=1 Tax=Mesorhizobium sp. L-8-10 TaxID=2744523 RepID=UPI0019278740|nr:TetR/AcrR family transcriptional regulator [Mesorhizobium sp. L-8-10]BCH32188.1 TetR family transcriptional regulator [Mesorhizobium sp. L-8-10]
MARPKEFDREKVLDRATRLFWERGFGGTSISDLEAAMGIGRTSIYAAFGAKEDLFMAAIDHYDATYSIKLRNALNAGLPVRQAIERYFEELMIAFGDPDLPLGCLVTNVAVEGDRGTTRMGRRIAASITRAEDTFYRMLRQAQVEGAIDPRADVRAIGRYLVASTHGLSALAKANSDLNALRDVVAVIMASVDTMFAGGSAANANKPRAANA